MASVKQLMENALTIRMLDENRFLELRRQVFDDGDISIDEADLIFAIDSQIDNLPEGWNEFFVGSLTDFLIRQTMPVGYVDTVHVSWLMERIEFDERLSHKTELELLLNILRLAKEVPETLELYTLNLIKEKIVARAIESDFQITGEDVKEIKRVLYACGGHGGYAVSETEARFLFDLDEISQSADNDPEWQKLFVGAIANHLMTMGAPVPASYGEARRSDEYLMSNETISWNLMRSFRSWSDQRDAGDTGSISSQFLDGERIAQAEVIDATEAHWLIKQINRDGTISVNEQALLAFIQMECPQIHDSLQPLLRYAA